MYERLIRIAGVLLFQVTFVSSEPLPPEFSRAIKLGNVTYNLYSHSFLHFGQVTIIHLLMFFWQHHSLFLYCCCLFEGNNIS